MRGKSLCQPKNSPATRVSHGFPVSQTRSIRVRALWTWVIPKRSTILIRSNISALCLSSWVSHPAVNIGNRRHASALLPRRTLYRAPKISRTAFCTSGCADCLPRIRRWSWTRPAEWKASLVAAISILSHWYAASVVDCIWVQGLAGWRRDSVSSNSSLSAREIISSGGFQSRLTS